jgi:hypothetical protein
MIISSTSQKKNILKFTVAINLKRPIGIAPFHHRIAVYHDVGGCHSGLGFPNNLVGTRYEGMLFGMALNGMRVCKVEHALPVTTLVGCIEIGIRPLLATLDKTVPNETGVRVAHHHLAQGFDAVI